MRFSLLDNTSAAAMPQDIPTRLGYTFNGWNTDPYGSGTQVYGADGWALKEGTYYDSEERWVYPGDVTLYAQWLSDNNIKIKVNGEWLTGNICWIKKDSGIWEQADSINEILKDSI